MVGDLKTFRLILVDQKFEMSQLKDFSIDFENLIIFNQLTDTTGSIFVPRSVAAGLRLPA